MLANEILNRVGQTSPIAKARQELEATLSQASVDEFLELMFSPSNEPARRIIDGILGEYDSQREQVLLEISRSVPKQHREFFVHAFTPRGTSK